MQAQELGREAMGAMGFKEKGYSITSFRGRCKGRKAREELMKKLKQSGSRRGGLLERMQFNNREALLESNEWGRSARKGGGKDGSVVGQLYMGFTAVNEGLKLSLNLQMMR